MPHQSNAQNKRGLRKKTFVIFCLHARTTDRINTAACNEARREFAHSILQVPVRGPAKVRPVYNALSDFEIFKITPMLCWKLRSSKRKETKRK